LAAIGFPVTILERAWHRFYAQLKQRFDTLGACDVRGITDPKLAAWCSSQRKRYAGGTMRDSEVDLLNALQFPFRRREDCWKSRCAQLRRIKAANGDLRFATEAYRGLAGWCKRQVSRSQKLSPEGYAELEALGLFDPQLSDFAAVPRTLAHLNLPPRASRLLKQAGIRTVHQLRGASEKELMRMKGCGEYTVLEIRRALERETGGAFRAEPLTLPGGLGRLAEDLALRNTPIHRLGLPYRAHRRLTQAGISTVDQLLAWDAAALRRWPGFGKGSLDSVQRALIQLRDGGND